MDKEKFMLDLKNAVEDTHKRCDKFLGVFVYGSFVTDKENPNDADLMPLYDTYDPFKDDFRLIVAVEDYFKKLFPKLPKPVKRRDGGTNDRFIHIGHGLTVLDDEHDLKHILSNFNIDYKNFIGTEEAKQELKRIYGEN